uniref:DUF1330 domain-containing protein n=1 Tax=Altererythrobacter segetis TaxID=1104773 RepID=UPI001409E58E
MAAAAEGLHRCRGRREGPRGLAQLCEDRFSIIQKYGGNFLTWGGRTIAVEGDPPAGRVMIIEFASLDRAKAFEYSEECSDIAPLRHASVRSPLLIIEGTADAAASKPRFSSPPRGRRCSPRRAAGWRH